MPLTLVELYRAEMDPICPNKELSPALSPASFHIYVYGIIKVNPPFPVLGWLKLEGNSDCFALAGAALLQDSISPGPRCVCPAELLCPWSFTSTCIPCVPVAWSLPQGVAGVANNRAGLACPATYLPLSNTEPFCGLSRIC